MRISLFLLALCGCSPMALLRPQLLSATWAHTGCPEEQLVVRDFVRTSPWGVTGTWTAEGCGRVWRCASWGGSGGGTLERCE